MMMIDWLATAVDATGDSRKRKRILVKNDCSEAVGMRGNSFVLFCSLYCMRWRDKWSFPPSVCGFLIPLRTAANSPACASHSGNHIHASDISLHRFLLLLISSSPSIFTLRRKNCSVLDLSKLLLTFHDPGHLL